MRSSQASFLPSLRAAWRWWSGEIASLIPAPLRRRFAGMSGRFVLSLTGSAMAELSQVSGDREERLACIELDQVAAARATLAEWRARRRGLASGLVLRLPEEAGLRTTITLPLAAQSNLAQVVSFELDRRTPFRSDEVYYTERVVRRDTAGQRLVAALTVAPRAAVDEALALADRLGVKVRAVELADRDASLAPGDNLLPERPQPMAARLPGLAVGVLASVAVVLLVTALLIPLYQAHQQASQLETELAEARRQAQESLKLEKEIEAAAQESDFLGLRKRQSPAMSEILYTLTHLLPDDTWLTELEVSSTEVQVTGYAGSASNVLSLLDQSPRFGNAAFRSPVMQDQRTNREQFNIGAHLTMETRSLSE